MSSNLPRITLRVSPKYIAKLKVIAKQSGRSINKEIEQLIIHHIADWEALHGVIEINASGNTSPEDE